MLTADLIEHIEFKLLIEKRKEYVVCTDTEYFNTKSYLLFLTCLTTSKSINTCIIMYQISIVFEKWAVK